VQCFHQFVGIDVCKFHVTPQSALGLNLILYHRASATITCTTHVLTGAVFLLKRSPGLKAGA
jgi:hypothetical protein